MVFASFVVVGFGLALHLVVVDFVVSLYLVEELVPASYPVEAAYQAVKEVAEIFKKKKEKYFFKKSYNKNSNSKKNLTA